MITGIHHVCLKCSNAESFQKTVDFYKNVIGMEILRSWGEGDDAGAMLKIGNDILEIFATGQAGDKTGSINHFAFYTDDPEECIDRIKKAGYPVTMEPTNMDIVLNEPVKGETYPLYVAFCVGPLGEEIEFFSERK